jgi:hypothetical protein
MTITALVPTARQRQFTNVGATAAGAKLYTWAAGGTTTPLATYSDAALTVPNTNPVIADASGLFGPIFLLPAVYLLEMKDANDLLLWQQDDVSDPGALVAGLTQTKVCTTQLDATSNTTLANIVGLTGFTLVLGGIYTLEIYLSGTAGASGGLKVALKYTTATLTNLDATATGFTASAVACQHTTSTTDQASLFAQTAAVLAVRITARITATTAGSFAIQAAQNASDGTTSSIYLGSWARLTQINA